CFFFTFFFISSRRRHTSFSRDWSSDVCSSDLWRERGVYFGNNLLGITSGGGGVKLKIETERECKSSPDKKCHPPSGCYCSISAQIGRASCRDRVPNMHIAESFQ